MESWTFQIWSREVQVQVNYRNPVIGKMDPKFSSLASQKWPIVSKVDVNYNTRVKDVDKYVKREEFKWEVSWSICNITLQQMDKIEVYHWKGYETLREIFEEWWYR